jgi:hypothetical protein
MSLQIVPLCLHCGGNAKHGSRGLCCRCYKRLEIRARYPVIRDCARTVGLGIMTPHDKPVASTDALPGTPEKIEAMGQRLAMGCTLYHPDDARGEDD